MMGGLKTDSAGFTLVETMIVLAVTGAILTSALVMVGGRQDRTRFNVGIAQTKQQTQQIINEVSNGYYPDTAAFSCTASGSGKVIISTGGSVNQGHNDGCVLLGKVAQFGQGADLSRRVVFPVVGRRLAGSLGSNEVTTLAEADPTPLRVSASGTGTLDLSDSTVFDGDLTVVDMWYDGVRATQKTNALAFLTSFASYEVDGSSLKSGSLSVDMYAVNNMTPGTADVNAAMDAVDAVALTKIKQADICFASGTTDQSGLLTIGNVGGNELSVNLKVMSGKTC